MDPQSKLVAREERRLRAVMRRALWIALAGIGCSTKAADVVAIPDAGLDAASSDSALPQDAGKEVGPPDRCMATIYQPSPPDTCGDYYTFPCGLPAGLTSRGDCYFSVNDCNRLCPDIHYTCRAVEGFCSTNRSTDGGDASVAADDGVVIPNEAGAVIIDCSTCIGNPGRVPAGLAPALAVPARSMLGAYFASVARLEAASVTAFRRLREELEIHGAPIELLEGARDAERDEVRHTLAMARLARRHGGRYARPVVTKITPRPLAVVAEENAVEGCARETFGALLATFQADHAPDGDVARTMAQIAADETRHAALSWAIARWSLAQLDDAARTRISAAWAAAMDQVSETDSAMAPLAKAAALPSPEQRAVLARELRGLWDELFDDQA